MRVQSLGQEDPWRRKWQPTPVFLPGESQSHGQRSQAGYIQSIDSQSDMTERLSTHAHSCFTVLCYFLLYSKMNQMCVYIYPLVFGFPSHLGHPRDLNRYSRQSLVTYFIQSYMCVCVCVCVSVCVCVFVCQSQSSSSSSFSLTPLVSMHLFSASVSLFLLHK